MKKIATGTRDQAKDGVRQIAVRFPDAMFQQIATTANQAGLSFAEYVRLMVKVGLEKGET